MHRHGSAPCYPKLFVRFWHHGYYLPVTSLQPIATASCVTSREAATDVVWLCLVISRKLSGVPERFLAGFATRAYLDDLLGGEGAMYRALPSDLEELRALLITQRPVEFYVQLDRVYPPFLGFTLGAVIGVDPRVLKPSCDASERQTFPLGIHREGHRCARPQRRKQQIVGVGP